MTTGVSTRRKEQQELPFVTLPKASLTECALFYEQTPTYAEWEAHGLALRQCSGAALWWIGDWFVWGEQQFGEEAYQAVGYYEPETIRKAIWISSRIPLANRNSKLSHAHHQEVAACSPGEQGKWLDLAEKEGLTKNELRASIKAGKVVTQDEIDQQRELAPALVDVELVFQTPHWLRFVKQQWIDRDKLPVGEKRRWLEALREPARMAAELERELEALR